MLTRPMDIAGGEREETLTEDPPDLQLIRGGQRPNGGQAPSEGPRPAPRAAVPEATFINKDVTLRGDIESAGHIQIHGRVAGDVQCKGLLVSENALIKGAIVAEAVLLAGRVVGPIRAARVTLKPTAHVEGDIFCQWIKMEEGAHFDGRMNRVDLARETRQAIKPESGSLADLLQQQ